MAQLSGNFQSNEVANAGITHSVFLSGGLSAASVSNSTSGSVRGYKLILSTPPEVKRYYKLRATCSAAASGYIEWVNGDGSDFGKPSCAGTLGPTETVAIWEVTG